MSVIDHKTDCQPEKLEAPILLRFILSVLENKPSSPRNNIFTIIKIYKKKASPYK